MGVQRKTTWTLLMHRCWSERRKSYLSGKRIWMSRSLPTRKENESRQRQLRRLPRRLQRRRRSKWLRCRAGLPMYARIWFHHFEVRIHVGGGRLALDLPLNVAFF